MKERLIKILKQLPTGSRVTIGGDYALSKVTDTPIRKLSDITIIAHDDEAFKAAQSIDGVDALLLDDYMEGLVQDELEGFKFSYFSTTRLIADCVMKLNETDKRAQIKALLDLRSIEVSEERQLPAQEVLDELLYRKVELNPKAIPVLPENWLALELLWDELKTDSSFVNKEMVEASTLDDAMRCYAIVASPFLESLRLGVTHTDYLWRYVYQVWWEPLPPNSDIDFRKFKTKGGEPWLPKGVT